jgi:hypothetical protein
MGTPREDAAVNYDPTADSARQSSSRVVQVKQKNEPRLMSIEGVRGVGVGRGATGDDEIVVYVRDASAQKGLPSHVDGIPVRGEVTGEIDAY